jgi:hypothetical protein
VSGNSERRKSVSSLILPVTSYTMSSFFCFCCYKDPLGKALDSHFKEDKRIEDESLPTLQPLPLHVTVGSGKFADVFRQHKVGEGFYAIPTGGSLVATSKDTSKTVVVQSSTIT